MGREVLDEAYRHFKLEGREYEYGRHDKSMSNKEGNGRTDASRTEEDRDGDGLYGVDCSSLVWRGLKDAGYDVGKSPWGTGTLFQGNEIQPYAKKNFDVISARDAKEPNGDLQPGDILMFKDKKSGGQHVGIFKGYDKDGNAEFFGSQVGKGPEMVKGRETGPGDYWNGGRFEIVGALRPKPEFQTQEPKHGRVAADAPLPGGGEAPAPSHRAPQPRQESAGGPKPNDGVLEKGEKGADVRQLQERLNALDVTDGRGRALETDGDYGRRTKEAVEAFQRANGLEPDGEAGPRTMEAMAKAERDRAQATPARDPNAGPLLSDPAHRDNAMYQQAVAGLEKLGGFKNHQDIERAAATLTYDARISGLNQIDHVARNNNGTGFFAVQGELNDPSHKRAYVDANQAINQSVEQSTQRLKQDVPQPAQQDPQQQQNQQQTQPPRTMVA